MNTVKPLNHLSRDEIRDLARAAAERGDPLHEACPYAAGSAHYLNFQNDYIEHRFLLEAVDT